MTTRHLVDPDLHLLIDAFPLWDFSDETLSAIRREMGTLLHGKTLPDLPVTCRDVFIPSGEVGRHIRCLLVQPLEVADRAGAILHFHGGGHVLGTPEMNQPQLMKWAASLACPIVSVDYRLAPETPFPGPMEDAYAALRWLHDAADSLGIDTARIVVSGESAGGAMAACLCLLARDRGEYAISAQHLEMPRLSPVLRDPPNPATGEFIWRRQDSDYCHSAYLAGSTSPYASAACAEDLTRLPPVYIMVGALDLFVDDCLDYAARLIRAGVSTELIVYSGCVHGFRMARRAAIVERADQHSLRALHEFMGKA